MISLTEENYLKALFHLADESNEVSVNKLSGYLGIKMPTVTSMMKRLKNKKLVYYKSYQPLRLTKKGRKEAALIIRKHRLTELFLVHKMGFGWEDVHEIAEQVEHIHSPVFFEKMDELLGYPTMDPHGSPIPDKNGHMKWKKYQRLNDCQIGNRVQLMAVTNTSHEFLQLLNKRQLILGLKLTIKAIEPFDGSMVISYGHKKIETLSYLICERLLVEKIN